MELSRRWRSRRGLEANIPVLLAGEPGFCMDTYKLFIGSAVGNKGVAMLASPVFTGMVTLPGIRVPLGDALGNLGIGTGVLASIGMTLNNTVVGVGALPSSAGVGFNSVFGMNALKSITTGFLNCAFGYGAGDDLTTGDTNILFGASAGPYLTTGQYNVVVGQNAFHSVLGSKNTIIGWSASHANAGDLNVEIGNQAGYYETGSSKLFIDNDKRADEADARIKALIYGVFDALTANQRLSINARLLVRECPNYANNAAALAGGLTSGELYTVTGTDPLQVARVV